MPNLQCAITGSSDFSVCVCVHVYGWSGIILSIPSLRLWKIGRISTGYGPWSH